jgi:two-component system, LuxR family, response regulator FixJ
LASYIRQALRIDADSRQARAARMEMQARLASLSPAERDVMEGLLRGKPNKQVARELDVSLRTVEGRRRAVFQKTQTDSIAALMQLVIEAREPQAGSSHEA